ncbi:class I SAM-dependent methyltransferase [Leeia oryzae]|uniref:class I SAM-dependent methyltransferase n=1 Tax=Leeia oryzae TaxID=356662 RepID=UPI000475B08E|nr:methyltransferase type 12 [Leeia oryzae]
MPGYQTKCETVTVGGKDYQIRSLLDQMQFADPDGEAERAGISSATWPLFGLLWPSARVLAQLMDTFDLAGKRVLEIGAGLALASMVVHRREGDATATDWHPLSPVFLKENLLLNQLSPMKYQRGNWAGENPELGLFDLIIGSDVLYERQQPEQLAHFIDTHAAPVAQIIIIDPDRGNRVGFCRAMAGLGYQFTMQRAPGTLENGTHYKGRILRFTRPLAA